MELLIFLSAILTALTGAVTGTRAAPDQPVAAACAVAAVSRAVPTAGRLPSTPAAWLAGRMLPARPALGLAAIRPALPSPLLHWSRRHE